MYRLVMFCLSLLMLAQLSVYGEDVREESDCVVRAVSTSAGQDAVLIETAGSTVHARSVTFKNGDDKIKIIARDNELEVRIGAIVLHTDNLRLPTTLKIDNLQILKFHRKPID